MARQVPNTDQKEQLKSNAEFQIQVKWAVINQALYWKNDGGAAKSDSPSAIRWATHRLFANSILNNPAAVDAQLAYWVGLFAGLLNNYQVVDDQVNPFDVGATVTYMVAQNTFQAMSDVVFDNLTANQVF